MRFIVSLCVRTWQRTQIGAAAKRDPPPNPAGCRADNARGWRRPTRRVVLRPDALHHMIARPGK